MNCDSVREFVKREVPDWDDEVVATARFKAFSGQRSDWELRYHLWKDLILKVARHFGLFIIRPSQVKEWFNRDGLTPLCIDHVLLIMYNEGEIVRVSDLADPTSGRLSQILKKVRLLMFRPSTAEEALEDNLVLSALLKDKALEVVKHLSESNWTSSCIATLKRFGEICGGRDEASAVLSYLSGCGKARYLCNRKKEVIEGVKVSLSSDAISGITSLDCDVLHLVWTTEKLQQQLDVIDRRYEKSRSSAVASLRSGNKKVALRHARELKLASESREKCVSLLNRVEEVLNAISNAESTRKVSEAIQIGARAMKENKIIVEEVEHCLDEIDESIESQKQLEKALESASSTSFEDEDVEDEFRKLELKIENENLQVESGSKSPIQQSDASETAASLSSALSSLRLVDQADENETDKSEQSIRKNTPETRVLQAEFA
ncbi:uncharacterized protein LOC116205064 isoform X2 [Punica granatum]|uniref:Uncharacterized protein LOC116205064 isoform X2 n=1 Tax=Punica granatum TaxID=22663 RepID=A0A6P8DJ53_PUNGR|nr:uncharacterized protein LOC116205064 isoform X2 [Punica granatum]